MEDCRSALMLSTELQSTKNEYLYLESSLDMVSSDQYTEVVKRPGTFVDASCKRMKPVASCLLLPCHKSRISADHRIDHESNVVP